MRQGVLILMVLCLSSAGMSQRSYTDRVTVKSHQELNVLADIGGNGLTLGIGLEHANFKYNTLKNTLRYGFSFITPSVYGEFNVNIGAKRNYFELGIGPNVIFQNTTDLFLFGRIGYRYHSSRFIFRAGFTPYVFFYSEFTSLHPYAGFSLGFPIRR